MKGYILSVIVILCCTLVCMAEEYVPCNLELQNGESFECYAKLQGGTYFKYKMSIEDEPLYVKARNVLFARLHYDTGTVIVSGMPVVQVYDAKTGKYNKRTHVGWIYFLDDPIIEDVSVYYHLDMTFFFLSFVTTNVYGCYKRGTSYGVDLYHPGTANRSSMLRKAGILFFSDCDDVVQFLKNKTNQFKQVNDFIGIVQEYNHCTKQ